jgi:Putative Flp pilus-assembly TadE/G-like
MIPAVPDDHAGCRTYPVARERSAGQVIVLFALFLTVFVGLMAIVVDFGFWLQEKRTYQNAADAAVLDGVSYLHPPLPSPSLSSQPYADAVVAAMTDLNRQLVLGIPAADISAAAGAASTQAGLSAASGDGYTGRDTFYITAPPDPDCGSPGSYVGNVRAITVRIDHVSDRFFSRLFAAGSETVGICATASSEEAGYAVAVLQPSDGTTQANSTNITMNLAGTNTYVTIYNGDVAVNATFGAQGNPPPTSPQTPSYVMFCGSSCSGGPSGNLMHLGLLNPNPLPWSIGSAQIRDATGSYVQPVQLNPLVQIPDWPANSALTTFPTSTPLTYAGKTAPTGSCTDPLTGVAGLDPGLYSQLTTGSYQTGSGSPAQNRLWLCPGTFYLVQAKTNSVTLGTAQGTTIAGQGVTLAFENNAVAQINSGANLLLDCDPTADADCGSPQLPAPWTTGWALHDVPIALWIRPVPDCTPNAPPCSDPSSVFTMTSNSSGIDVDGVIFGPTDQMKIAGNSLHHGAGEVWAWTLTYVGGSTLSQVYKGPDVSYPVLVQ